MALVDPNKTSEPENSSIASTSTTKSSPVVGPPLDLSFKCMLAASDIKEEVQNHIQENLPKSPRTKKYSCNAIRLNNNSMSDMNGFDDTVQEIIENSDDVAWIDVSFNELQTIDKVITKFQNLKVLYLHGNMINKIQEVNKLAALPHLRSLTLHGNPIETEKGYRQYVLSALPGLKTFDFSGVTKQDRATANTWRSMNAKAMKNRKNVPS
ncbi:leucine-rich repeat-containing protein 51-like isoform X2 [Clavelina lepadiformis]|uniref:Leucine-rich repeat-containing protein 51 n=1 Tax=Clavelina lepadiformis TaxID=159417 RepID=A0ABP0G058_CLALP